MSPKNSASELFRMKRTHPCSLALQQREDDEVHQTERDDGEVADEDHAHLSLH